MESQLALVAQTKQNEAMAKHSRHYKDQSINKWINFTVIHWLYSHVMDFFNLRAVRNITRLKSSATYFSFHFE